MYYLFQIIPQIDDRPAHNWDSLFVHLDSHEKAENLVSMLIDYWLEDDKPAIFVVLDDMGKVYYNLFCGVDPEVCIITDDEGNCGVYRITYEKTVSKVVHIHGHKFPFIKV